MVLYPSGDKVLWPAEKGCYYRQSVYIRLRVPSNCLAFLVRGMTVIKQNYLDSSNLSIGFFWNPWKTSAMFSRKENFTLQIPFPINMVSRGKANWLHSILTLELNLQDPKKYFVKTRMLSNDVSTTENMKKLIRNKLGDLHGSLVDHMRFLRSENPGGKDDYFYFEIAAGWLSNELSYKLSDYGLFLRLIKPTKAVEPILLNGSPVDTCSFEMCANPVANDRKCQRICRSCKTGPYCADHIATNETYCISCQPERLLSIKARALPESSYHLKQIIIDLVDALVGTPVKKLYELLKKLFQGRKFSTILLWIFLVLLLLLFLIIRYSMVEIPGRILEWLNH